MLRRIRRNIAAHRIYSVAATAVPREGSDLPARSPDLPASARRAVFASEGEFWAIGNVDSRFLMRDLKGLGYLQHLLRYPNQEFHCLELLGGMSDAEGRREDNGSAVSRGDSISAHHPADS